MNAIGLALSLTNRFAGSHLADRLKLRKPAERLAYTVTRSGFSVATKGQQVLQKRKHKTPSNKKNKALLFDLTLTEEQHMIRENAARLADSLREQAITASENHQPSKQLWQESDELGMGFFVLPESMEGMNMANTSEVWLILAEELSRGDMGQALALLSPVSAALCLTRWGRSSLQNAWLPKLAETGRIQGAIAHRETGHQQCLKQPRCSAAKKGQNYRLNGTKTLVPLASSAEFFLVSASTGKKSYLYLVHRNTKGLTVTTTKAMGLHSADLGTLTLKNVDIPLDHCLDANDFDFDHWLARSQIAASALACGTAQAVLDYVIPYCNDRQAFGEPISHRQSVAFMIADIATELEGMKLLNNRAASRAEHGLPFVREARLAHHQSSTKGMQIGTDGVQLLGGHGFIQEHPVERWYRDLRAIPLLEGSLVI